MVPAGRPMAFLPGQFVFVDFHQDGISAETHPFSIASTPGQTTLEVVVRSLGDYTSRLMGLKPGAMARVEGPFGRFTYHRHRNRDQIWIAGGIGITPFMSMVQDARGLVATTSTCTTERTPATKPSSSTSSSICRRAAPTCALSPFLPIQTDS